MVQTARTLVFELNEFNLELLREATENGQYPHIARMIGLKKTVLSTKDTYESDYLEPWVQWVSFHTGVPSSDHKIKHLGDCPDLGYPQLWETLSQRGVSSGVWGVLNGNRGRAQECRFFLPDPWTFSEHGYPVALNALLGLPRYLARNRVKFSAFQAFREFATMLGALAKPKILWELLRETPHVMGAILKHPRSAYVYFTITEYLSGMLFLDFWNRARPQVGVLFLNSLAHLQHYYWEKGTVTKNDRIMYGLRYIDKILKQIFDGLEPNDIFIGCTALSQMNTNHEKPWISYRPKDHIKLLRKVGINVRSVEPLMSYDALAFFHTKEDCLMAQQILEGARILGQPLFAVESYPNDPLRLFYRLSFYDEVPGETTFTAGDQSLPFSEYFASIIRRTGKHVPVGYVFSNAPAIPERMENHELNGYLLGLYETAT